MFQVPGFECFNSISITVLLLLFELPDRYAHHCKAKVRKNKVMELFNISFTFLLIVYAITITEKNVHFRRMMLIGGS